MPAITVRDVPDETRDELAARAARSGRSMQEYLRAELMALADRPDQAELIARIRERVKREGTVVGGDEIVAARDADRR